MTAGDGGDAIASDLAFARETAERAGRILFERYERVGAGRRQVGARDVVTEVDHLSEALVIGAIRERFPTDGILAEESGAHRTDAAGTTRGLAVGRTWVIDPLDGTINYANGIPYFCVAIGLVVDGVPAVGVVHDPMRERDVLGGRAAGPPGSATSPCHASDKAALGDCVISLALGGRAVATRGRAIRKAIRVSRNMGSAALALAYVANGRFDAFLQSAGMSAWDVAAAGLIAERAGATVTDMKGGALVRRRRDHPRRSASIAAPVAHHAELLRLAAE